MKMNKKYILLLSLLVLTALLAGWYLTTRDTVPENSIRVTWAGKTTDLDVTNLTGEPVKGTLVSGKGKETAIDTTGLSLQAALAAARVDTAAVESVTVTAQDAFSAELSGEEMREEGKAYLILENGGATLVVFGDSNSKRNVRQVMQIDVR